MVANFQNDRVVIHIQSYVSDNNRDRKMMLVYILVLRGTVFKYNNIYSLLSATLLFNMAAVLRDILFASSPPPSILPGKYYFDKNLKRQM